MTLRGLTTLRISWAKHKDDQANINRAGNIVILAGPGEWLWTLEGVISGRGEARGDFIRDPSHQGFAPAVDPQPG